MLNYKYIFIGLLAASINLTSAKLNKGSEPTFTKASDEELTEVMKLEKQKITTYFDEATRLLDKLVKEYKTIVDKIGDTENKTTAANEEKLLKEAVEKLKVDTKVSTKSAWTTEEYKKYITEYEAALPKLYEHVAKVKKLVVEACNTKGDTATKLEYDVRNVKESSELVYGLVKYVLDISKKRLEEVDGDEKDKEGKEYLKEVEDKLTNIKVKSDLINNIVLYNEETLKTAKESYGELKTLVEQSGANATKLFELAKKSMKAKSKEATMTFFEKHASGFLKNTSSALLNVVSTHIVLVTLALFTMSNL
uniref:Uncharacterized protein n=1 Tax=Babesia rodhaini TaxID=5870 RepID=A0A2Z6E9G8_BABRO|nr:hypothetical protein [Babesia rodhaini]